MELLPEQMEYRFRKAGSVYLVWLQALNRYMQLEEPAFRVFQELSEGLSQQEMIRSCVRSYHLPSEEAERFIGEIREQFKTLYKDYQMPELPGISMEALPPSSASPFQRFISIRGKRVRFSFGDRIMEQLIFPLYRHLQLPPDRLPSEMHLELFRYQGKLYLVRDKTVAFQWPSGDAHKLKGALQMELINLIHHTSVENWMGVIHASSVSRGKHAVMFPARAGAGKSTLAALLMAHGFELVSDDFTPIDRGGQQIYSFPGAISVKQGSLPLLSHYFPQLGSAPELPHLTKGEKVSYLSPSNDSLLNKHSFPVRAILFVQYEEHTGCQLDRVNNLDVINDFLAESWLAHDSRAAEQFMDWYLKTPCYRLRYGKHQEAIQSIQKLF